MTDQHIAVEMDSLAESNASANRDRSTSRSRSKSPQPRRRATRAVSEAEDDGNNDGPDVIDPTPGVDDGLLDNADSNKKNGPVTPTNPNGRIPNRRRSFAGPDTILIDGIEVPIPDVNDYQHKKTLAQGMMDLALLTANANQLRYVLESYKRHPYYYPSLIFITLSILFQIAVGVGLILNSRYNVNDPREICKANRISNYTVIGIFIVTVVNVFISAFGVANAPDGV